MKSIAPGCLDTAPLFLPLMLWLVPCWSVRPRFAAATSKVFLKGWEWLRGLKPWISIAAVDSLDNNVIRPQTWTPLSARTPRGQRICFFSSISTSPHLDRTSKDKLGFQELVSGWPAVRLRSANCEWWMRNMAKDFDAVSATVELFADGVGVSFILLRQPSCFVRLKWFQHLPIKILAHHSKEYQPQLWNCLSFLIGIGLSFHPWNWLAINHPFVLNLISGLLPSHWRLGWIEALRSIQITYSNTNPWNWCGAFRAAYRRPSPDRWGSIPAKPGFILWFWRWK